MAEGRQARRPWFEVGLSPSSIWTSVIWDLDRGPISVPHLSHRGGDWPVSLALDPCDKTPPENTGQNPWKINDPEGPKPRAEIHLIRSRLRKYDVSVLLQQTPEFLASFALCEPNRADPQ